MKKLYAGHSDNSIRSTFFRNMFLTSTLFIMLLFVATSFLFWKNTFYQESRNALHQLDYISNQLEFYLDSTENYSKTIISDTNVQQYMKTSFQYSGEDTDTARNKAMKEQIRQIIQSTPFIHSVTLYASDGELLVTTEPYSRSSSLEEFPSAVVWRIREKASLTSARQSVKAVSRIQPFYSISSGQLLGYIEIAIPEPKISDIYRAHTSTSVFFMVDAEGQVQSSTGFPELDSIYPSFKSIMESTDSFCFVGGNLVFSHYFSHLDWYIINQISILQFLAPLLSLFVVSLLIVLFVILLCTYVSHRIADRITAPLSYLVSHTQTVIDGNWIPIQYIPCNDEIRVLMEAFNNMIEIQSEMKDNLVKAEKLKRHLSLSLLQQQIKPHFLYNTLDNICSLAELDEKEILIQLVMNLSAFYRSSLSNGKMHVTIEEELQISRAYLEILQIRYYNKFSYSISCPDELKHCSCIKLLLQPIIENSVYHGIKELSAPGRIDISVTASAETILLSVTDNGKGIAPDILKKIWEENNSHYGIKNIHQRIQLYYGKEYGLSISPPSEGGCRTTITLPKKEENSCVSIS